jgi:hypothetical protein
MQRPRSCPTVALMRGLRFSSTSASRRVRTFSASRRAIGPAGTVSTRWGKAVSRARPAGFEPATGGLEGGMTACRVLSSSAHAVIRRGCTVMTVHGRRYFAPRSAPCGGLSPQRLVDAVLPAARAVVIHLTLADDVSELVQTFHAPLKRPASQAARAAGPGPRLRPAVDASASRRRRRFQPAGRRETWVVRSSIRCGMQHLVIRLRPSGRHSVRRQTPATCATPHRCIPTP